MKTTAITLAPPLKVERTQPVTVIEIIGEMARHGVTKDNAEAMTALCKLKNDEEDRNAEKEFNSAFVKLQEELPAIVAQSVIPNRGKYERFEDLAKVVGPILRRNGFAFRFSQPMDENGKPITEPGRVTVIGKLSHIGGHSETGQFTVRSSGKSDSETQADTKAATTAKRYCYSQMLNLVIRQDEDDASLEGHPINPEQAKELERLVKATGTLEPSFFKYAGGKEPVKGYSDIMSNRYDELHEYLSKRERVQKQKSTQ